MNSRLTPLMVLLMALAFGPQPASAAIERIKTKKLIQRIETIQSEKKLKKLAKIYFADPVSEGQNKAFRALLARGESEGWTGLSDALAKYVFRQPHYYEQDAAIESYVRSNLGQESLRRLNRFMFGRKEYRDFELAAPNRDRLRILHAAVKLTDANTRNLLIDRAQALLRSGDSNRLERILQPFLAPRVPSGYKLVKRFLGVGKTGEASLVRRNSDGSLFAWKFPVNDSPLHLQAMKEEVSRLALWQESGMTDIEVFFTDDGKSLMKSYVPGKTLHEIMDEVPRFFKSQDPRLPQLAELIRTSIKNRVFVDGASWENIKYTGTQWKLIDAEGATRMSTEDETYRAYRDTLLTKWGRLDFISEQSDIREFLEAI